MSPYSLTLRSTQKAFGAPRYDSCASLVLYLLIYATEQNEPAPHLFWFKIGDAKDALKREWNYKGKNPSFECVNILTQKLLRFLTSRGRFIPFTVNVDEDVKPGKMLEKLTGLHGNQAGTNGEGTC